MAATCWYSLVLMLDTGVEISLSLGPYSLLKVGLVWSFNFTKLWWLLDRCSVPLSVCVFWTEGWQIVYRWCWLEGVLVCGTGPTCGTVFGLGLSALVFLSVAMLHHFSTFLHTRQSGDFALTLEDQRGLKSGLSRGKGGLGRVCWCSGDVTWEDSPWSEPWTREFVVGSGTSWSAPARPVASPFRPQASASEPSAPAEKQKQLVIWKTITIHWERSCNEYIVTLNKERKKRI